MLSIKTAPSAMLFFLACMTLFKPGSEFGTYEWLIKSAFTLKVGLTFFLISLLGFLVSLAITFRALRPGGHTFKLSKSGLISVLAGSAFAILTNLANFSIEPTFAIKRIAAIVIVLIAIWIYQTSTIRSNLSQQSNTAEVLHPLEMAISLYLIVSFGLAFYDPLTTFSPELQGSRMYALSDHPNFLGIIAAIGALLIANHLFLKWKSSNAKIDRHQVRRFLLLFLSIWIIIQSGSRTSLLVFSLGIIILTPIRVSAILAIPFAVIAVWLNINSILIADSGLRILSTENNRTFAWDSMTTIFLSHPLFGVGLRSVGFSENSYLWIASSSGLLGIAGLVLLLMITLSNRRNLHISAFIAPLYFGAIFEGYFLDSFSLPILLFLLPTFSFPWKRT